MEKEVLTIEHLREMERILSTDVEPQPYVVSPGILKELKQLGVCTDNFIASAPLLPYNNNNANTP